MITPEQRQLRKKYLGSSDIAAVLGLDHYRSAADVWLDKTGRDPGFAGNDDTERGELLEPVVLNWAEKQLGRPLQRDVFVVRPDCDELCANLDAFDRGQSAVVEAKTSVQGEQWGDEGTDQIPERVLVQVHHQMHVVNCRLAFVPVLLPGYRSFDFRLYRVERNDELADIIAKAGINFMRLYVRTDKAPDDFRPSLEVLKRVKRQPNKTVPVSDELVDALIVAKAAAKQASKDCEIAEAMLLSALDDAEGGEYSKGLVSYLETQRKGYTVQATTCRSLRIKANKLLPGRAEQGALAT